MQPYAWPVHPQDGAGEGELSIGAPSLRPQPIYSADGVTPGRPDLLNRQSWTMPTSVVPLPGIPGEGTADAPGMPSLGQPGPSNYSAYHPIQPAVEGGDVRRTFSAADLAQPETAYHPVPPSRYLPHLDLATEGGAQYGLNVSEEGSAPAQAMAPPHTTPRHYNNGNVGPSLKRGMACTFCRRRKLRCDAMRPVCSQCIRFRKVCEYQNTTLRSAIEPDDTQLISPVEHYRSDSEQSQHQQPAFPFNANPGYRPSEASYPASDSMIPAGPYSYGVSQPPQQPSSLPFTQYGMLSFPPWQPTHGAPTPGIPAAPLGPPPPPAQSSSFDLYPSSMPSLTPSLPAITPSHPSVITPMDHTPSSQQSYIDPRPPLQALVSENSHKSSSSSVKQSSSSSIKQSPTSAPRSMRSTPDPSAPPPPSALIDPRLPYTYSAAPPKSLDLHAMYDNKDIDPIEGLTERLGEFLFSPTAGEKTVPSDSTGQDPKRRRSTSRTGKEKDKSANQSLFQVREESDGLTDAQRDRLLATFLSHSRLFFEMSVPRFKYRMTFLDKRRPSLAILNAMYLWGTRFSGSATQSEVEERFFAAGCRNLEATTSRADRLLDGMRAAMLLSAYAYTRGRFHEGWLLNGIAMRLVVSSGIHQIPSSIFSPPPPKNPLLRSRSFLLPPPEDKLELAERIHTFWAIMSLERCGCFGTGFMSALRDDEFTTPLPRALHDIASGNVTRRDDVTARDLFRFSMLENDEDPLYLKWVKAVLILERASKLALIDPNEDSEYARAWSQHSLTAPGPSNPVPPPWLDQPKYRCPKEYGEVKLALDQYVTSLGAEGIFPVDRKRNAQIDGGIEPYISSHHILLHHYISAIHMLMHDINSVGCENREALVGARKNVALFRDLTPLPLGDIDSFAVLVWSTVARVLIKEMHRLRGVNDLAGAKTTEEEADAIISEIQRVGVFMGIARSYASAVLELRNMDMADVTESGRASPVDSEGERRHSERL